MLDRNTLTFSELPAADCGFSYRRSIFNSTQRERFIVTRVDYKLQAEALPVLQYPDLKRFFQDRAETPTLAETAAAVREIRHRKGMLLVEGEPDCRSAGSFFKNPIVPQAQYDAIAARESGPVPCFAAQPGFVKIPAAWLVEHAGFQKGFALGAAGISSRHTLALINRGGAKAGDVLALRDRITSDGRVAIWDSPGARTGLRRTGESLVLKRLSLRIGTEESRLLRRVPLCGRMAAMDRRAFLRNSALASGATLCGHPGFAQTASSVSLRLKLDRHKRGNPIPADFTGLSYETSQLGDPAFFSPDNTELAGFIRRLGKSGVLRVGGNSSEYAHWSPEPATQAAAAEREEDQADVLQQALRVDLHQGPAKHSKTTPQAVRNLRGFIDATGWKLIYGLNMGTGTAETAAAEADFVMRTMGDKLIAFQLCNEPDLFYRNSSARRGLRLCAVREGVAALL